MVKNIRRGKVNTITGVCLIIAIILKNFNIIEGDVMEYALYISAGVSGIVQFFSPDPQKD